MPPTDIVQPVSNADITGDDLRAVLPDLVRPNRVAWTDRPARRETTAASTNTRASALHRDLRAPRGMTEALRVSA